MKKAIVLALAVIATSVVAASAQGSQKVAGALLANFNCSEDDRRCRSSPRSPAVPASSGPSRRAGRSTRSRRSHRSSGSRSSSSLGDTPVEQGPAPALDARAEVHRATSACSPCSARRRPAMPVQRRSRTSRRESPQVSPSATQTDLTYATPGDPLIGTPAFFRVVARDDQQGSTDAKFMVDKLQGEEGRARWTSRSRTPSGLAAQIDVVAEEGGRHGDPPVGPEHDDRLLGVRDEGAVRHGHRLLPDAEAGRRADDGAAADRAGQEGEGVRRRRVERPGAVQGAGLVRLQLRCTGSACSRTTRRSSPVGSRTTPGSRSARSARPPTGRFRSILRGSRQPATTVTASIKHRRCRDQSHQAREDQELDHRRNVQVLDEDERSAEPRVLHLPDPAQRLVQARPVARQLSKRRPGGGPVHGPPPGRSLTWTRSSS